MDTFSAKPAWAIGSSRAKKLARCVRFVVALQQGDAGCREVDTHGLLQKEVEKNHGFSCAK